MNSIYSKHSSCTVQTWHAAYCLRKGHWTP